MTTLSTRHMQELADRRAVEARALFEVGHYSGAYYLAGYAAECALKALIAGQFEAGVIPDKRVVNQIYTHKLHELIKLAGIDGERQELAYRQQRFAANLQSALDWTEESRYELFDEASARQLIDAMFGSDYGVFQWIRSKW